jgi:hypothetical protein
MLDGPLRTMLERFLFSVGYFDVTGKPWAHALACDEIAGKTPFVLAGLNEAVGATWEAVWGPSIVYPWATADQTITVRSSSANDTNLGSGAWIVRVWWLDVANVEHITDYVMNGINPVTDPTAVTARRVNRVDVLANGSVGNGPFGILTVYWTDNVTRFASIPTAHGRAGGIMQTVPAGYRDVLLGWNATPTGVGSRLQLLSRSTPTAAWERVDEMRALALVAINRPLIVPKVLPAGTDYIVECLGGNVIAAAVFGWREAA